MRELPDGMHVTEPYYLLIMQTREKLKRVKERLRGPTKATVNVGNGIPYVGARDDKPVEQRWKYIISVGFNRDLDSISTTIHGRYDALNELLELTSGDRLFFGYWFVEIETDNVEKFDFEQLPHLIGNLYGWTVTSVQIRNNLRES